MDKFIMLEKMAVINKTLDELTATQQIGVLVECLAAKAVQRKKEEVTIKKCIVALQKYLEDEIHAYYQTKLKLEGRI